jgi:hypothetical protein
VPQTDPVWDWIFYFRKTQNLPEENREREHCADAGERQRTRGAQNAKSVRLSAYGFFTSVAVYSRRAPE